MPTVPRVVEYRDELMAELDPRVAEVHAAHRANQKLWSPSELLPADFTPVALPSDIAAMLVLNLLTEDGLPYFTSLLVHTLGPRFAIWDWVRTWTAEEDRHGAAIKQYLNRTLSREQRIAVEKTQYNYLTIGFWPEWGQDPFKLFAYVIVQELATQRSHAGIAKHAQSVDPVLVKLLGNISSEEFRHHTAYMEFFTAAMRLDPSAAMIALSEIAREFDMPGKSIPDFSELAYIQMQRNVFGPAELADILLLISKKLRLGELSGLTSDGERARDKFFARIKALERAAEIARKAPPRTIKLSVLGDTLTI